MACAAYVLPRYATRMPNLSTRTAAGWARVNGTVVETADPLFHHPSRYPTRGAGLPGYLALSPR